MEFIYVLLALALAVGAYFLFFRKREEPALTSGDAAPTTKQKSERAPSPTTKAAAESKAAATGSAALGA